MMYDSDKHYRRSIRLKGYDYSQAGAYFLTICTHGRECLFGEIVNGEMRLNSSGEIVQACWQDLLRHFPHIELDSFVVMPNHVHGVIFIRRRGEAFGTPNASPLPPHGTQPGSLSAIVQNYKSLSTRKINHLHNSLSTPIWQRNYHEHIVRDEKSLNDIRNYIQANPSRWDDDEENPCQISRRRALMKLPMEERRRILAKQAERSASYYKKDTKRIDQQGGELVEYQ